MSRNKPTKEDLQREVRRLKQMIQEFTAEKEGLLQRHQQTEEERSRQPEYDSNNPTNLNHMQLTLLGEIQETQKLSLCMFNTVAFRSRLTGGLGKPLSGGVQSYKRQRPQINSNEQSLRSSQLNKRRKNNEPNQAQGNQALQRNQQQDRGANQVVSQSLQQREDEDFQYNNEQVYQDVDEQFSVSRLRQDLEKEQIGQHFSEEVSGNPSQIVVPSGVSVDEYQEEQNFDIAQSEQQEVNQDQDFQEQFFGQQEYYEQYQKMIEFAIKFKSQKYVQQVFSSCEGRYGTISKERRIAALANKRIQIPFYGQYLFHKSKPVDFTTFFNYNWSNLYEINMINCSISDPQFKRLVEGSESYPQLKILYLSYNHITTVTEEMLSKLKQLQFVDFGREIKSQNIELSPASVDQLKKYQKSHKNTTVLCYQLQMAKQKRIYHKN